MNENQGKVFDSNNFGTGKQLIIGQIDPKDRATQAKDTGKTGNKNGYGVENNTKPGSDAVQAKDTGKTGNKNGYGIENNTKPNSNAAQAKR